MSRSLLKGNILPRFPANVLVTDPLTLSQIGLNYVFGLDPSKLPPIPGSGSGNVVGPSSSNINAIARFGNTSGTVLKNSNVTVADSGIITAAAYGTGIIHSDSGGNLSSSLISTGDISNGQITYGKIQNVTLSPSFLGRISPGSGSIEELNGTQATSLLDGFSSTLKGVAPASGGGVTTFLRADGTWSVLNPVVALVDGPTPPLDASLGNIFTLSAVGDRTIAVPTNPLSGQKIVIRHFASGAPRTLSLNTGAGGFRFGSDIPSLTTTAVGKNDYVGSIYNATDNKWDVVAYARGY
jgi:hypothetical protein